MFLVLFPSERTPSGMPSRFDRLIRFSPESLKKNLFLQWSLYDSIQYHSNCVSYISIIGNQNYDFCSNWLYISKLL